MESTEIVGVNISKQEFIRNKLPFLISSTNDGTMKWKESGWEIPIRFNERNLSPTFTSKMLGWRFWFKKINHKVSDGVNEDGVMEYHWVTRYLFWYEDSENLFKTIVRVVEGFDQLFQEVQDKYSPFVSEDAPTRE